MSKTTNWFAGFYRPVRTGVYQKRVYVPDERVFYSHWNGDYWGYLSDSIQGAYNKRDYPTHSQSADWRGLAEKPKQ